jgi:hypothetical protein
MTTESQILANRIVLYAIHNTGYERRSSAVLSSVALAEAKADAFVAMSQLCKTNPICWILK